MIVAYVYVTLASLLAGFVAGWIFKAHLIYEGKKAVDAAASAVKEQLK